MLDKDKEMNEWQYSNQFFLEGKDHFETGGLMNDCPYNYLSVDQDNEKLVQSEHYREKEWRAGFIQGFNESLENKKTA